MFVNMLLDLRGERLKMRQIGEHAKQEALDPEAEESLTQSLNACPQVM